MRAPLTVAAAQPVCVAFDVAANAAAHAETIRAAQARVVVFPELSLTGYELDAEVVAAADTALAPITDACRAGWRVGLGICKDTGVTEHVDAVARLDADLYVGGLVHHDHELAEQEARAERIARACGSYVAFASFAGPTGGGYLHTAGASAVWAADGTALVRAGAGAGEYARATVT